MALPVHIGAEHPNLWWLVGTALVAFVGGLVVNVYRTRRSAGASLLETVSEEERE